jgi:hypothetical protein
VEEDDLHGEDPAQSGLDAIGEAQAEQIPVEAVGLPQALRDEDQMPEPLVAGDEAGQEPARAEGRCRDARPDEQLDRVAVRVRAAQ